MRIKFKPLALCFGIVAGLVSCSSDDDNNGVNPIIDEGTPTSIKLSITQPKTYATVDPNATDAEAALKTVDVFIYNAANTLVRHAALTDADFVQNGSNGNNDLYESVTSINTTTGPKTVYVGVNLPASIVSNIRSTGTAAGIEAVNSITVSDIANASSGFSMFSTDPKTSTFVEDETDPANNITVTVSRLAAKLTVHAGQNLNTTASGGTISDVSFLRLTVIKKSMRSRKWKAAL